MRSNQEGLLVEERREMGGLAGWLVRRFSRCEAESRRLRLIERIALGQRQTLALVEADGQRVLVVSSAEGGAAFHALDEPRTTRPSVVRPA